MDITRFKNILETRKNQLEEILYNLRNEMSGISKCEVKDDSDFASYSQDSTRNYILYQKQQEELNDIKYALSKFKTNNYGICEMCDTEIDEKRLEIRAHSKYCVECKTMIVKGK